MRTPRSASANGSRPSLVARSNRRHRIYRVYIERDSAWYAKAVASKIVETAETIPEFPELGRMVPEVGDPAIRERFAYSYRIIYRLEPERVLVAAVIHGSRLLQPFVQRIENAQKSKP